MLERRVQASRKHAAQNARISREFDRYYADVHASARRIAQALKASG